MRFFKEFNDCNSALIIIRTRGRSSKNWVYWAAQVFGSFFIDASVTLKCSCAFLCWSIVVVFVYLSILLPKVSRYLPLVKRDSQFQKTYTCASELHRTCYCCQDRYQWPRLPRTCMAHDVLQFPRLHMANNYWLMGAISNDPAKLNFAGFCKFSHQSHVIVLILMTFYFLRQLLPVFQILLSFGASTFCDDHKLYSFPKGCKHCFFNGRMNIFISTWVLVTAGMMFAFPLRTEAHGDWRWGIVSFYVTLPRCQSFFLILHLESIRCL